VGEKERNKYEMEYVWIKRDKVETRLYDCWFERKEKKRMYFE